MSHVEQAVEEESRGRRTGRLAAVIWWRARGAGIHFDLFVSLLVPCLSLCTRFTDMFVLLLLLRLGSWVEQICPASAVYYA